MAPAFAPVSDGRNVHCVEIRITVVALPSGRDQRTPVLQIERITEVRLPGAAVLIARLVRPARTGDLIPLGKRVRLIIRHDANCQALMMLPRLLEGQVDDVPLELPLLGLDGRPEPAAVRD